MNARMLYAALCLLSYLVGAIPFGLIVARGRGVDIRTVGSRNIGATNVFRSIGKPWGVLTFVCDLLKGFVPAAFAPALGAWVAHRLLNDADLAMAVTGRAQLLSIACGVAAILGHNFPVYLKFRGGKGVATSAGVLLGIAPAAVGVGVAVWIVVFLLGRYVSVASIVAALAIAGAGIVFYLPRGRLLPTALALLAALAIGRHRSNIQRLMKGTENRFEFGRKKHNTEAPPPA